jgi:hypothetical protein
VDHRLVPREGLPEDGEQAFGYGVDQLLGPVAALDAGQHRHVLCFPGLKQPIDLLAAGAELRMVEDEGLDLVRVGFEAAEALPLTPDPSPPTPRPRERREQCIADAGKHPPVDVEALDVAIGNASLEVGLDVLKVLRLAAIDVARYESSSY